MSLWGTALSFGLPIVGNLILPGFGGLLGAAAGNIAAEWVDGNIDSFSDALVAGGVGAAGSMLGGAAGRLALGKFGKNAAEEARGLGPLNAWREKIPKNFAHNLGLFQNAPRNWKFVGDTLGRGTGSYLAYKYNESIPGVGSIFRNDAQGPGPMKVINIGNGPD
ncbi:hypothetical protein ACRS6B_00145 [Nocardia asteroides]